MPRAKKPDDLFADLAAQPEKLAAFLDKIPLTREGLVGLMNLSGQRNGWGQITTTTTIGDLATNGLPRRKAGRSYFYSLADYGAYLAWRSKNRADGGADQTKQFQTEKLKEELRRLKRENDEADGVLIDVARLEDEWKVAGGVVNTRLRALADRLRDDALTGQEAAEVLENIGNEMIEAVERSLKKATKTKEKKR